MSPIQRCRVFILFAAFGVLAAPVHAAPSAQPASGAASEAPAAGKPGGGASVVLQLEDDWALGLPRRDAAMFRRLLAEGFVYTEDDRMVERDAVLHDLIASADTVEAAHNEGMSVHAFGSTAVVTGWLVVRGHGAGAPSDRRYRFTDTWVRLKGAWKLVAAQDYLVPASRH